MQREAYQASRIIVPASFLAEWRREGGVRMVPTGSNKVSHLTPTNTRSCIGTRQRAQRRLPPVHNGQARRMDRFSLSFSA